MPDPRGPDRLSRTPDGDRGEHIRRAWDRIADGYQERYRIAVDDLHFGPMCPRNRELRLVPGLAGRRVLEIGCGGGQNIVHAALAGAGRAVGVDPSGRQLAHARSLALNHGVDVELHRLAAENLSQLQGLFDVVLSAYALMYVEDVQAVLDEVERLLAPDGLVVISVDHPFRLAGEWRGDDFVLGAYFDERWQSWDYDFPEIGLRCEMHRFHRTVGSWVNAVTGSGLVLMDVWEPLPPAEPDSFARHSKHGTDSPLNVFSAERLHRLPGTLILRARKRDRPTAEAERGVT